MSKEKPNRQYKDSVFVDLFANDKTAKANFLSLYNALHGTNLSLSTELKPLRLDNVMYMNIRNDVSYFVDNKIIVLAEHQSTVNENMPYKPHTSLYAVYNEFAIKANIAQLQIAASVPSLV